MTKHGNDRIDDCTILPMIRQVLLYWGYELVENKLQ